MVRRGWANLRRLLNWLMPSLNCVFWFYGPPPPPVFWEPGPAAAGEPGRAVPPEPFELFRPLDRGPQPPAGHPERIPDLPLSEAERGLWAQLDHLA